MAGFRTIVINKRCKLESRLGSLVIRCETEEKIYIKEIETLIIESTAISLTSSLMVDLTEAGVNVIFCNKKHLPISAFIPMHSHFSVAKNIKKQIAWDTDLKLSCYLQIIKEKIYQQALVLSDYGYEGQSELLISYKDAVKMGDPENYEAQSAREYFKALFGYEFNRNLPIYENFALNYGYMILLSSFAREISACGYLTELGIWHRGAENAFNLASDFMEPFRIIVDRLVYQMPEEEYENDSYKRYMLKLLSTRIKIDGENQSLIPAIRIYIRRIFNFLNGEEKDIFKIEIMDENRIKRSEL